MKIKDANTYLTKKMVGWLKYDEFLSELLADLIVKAQSGNDVLAGHVGLIVEKTSSTKVEAVTIANLLKENAAGVEKVERMIDAKNERYDDVMALLGTIRNNILLTQRLYTFRNFIESYRELCHEDLPSDLIRKKLENYGINLQLFWDQCLGYCGSAAEKDLIKFAVQGGEGEFKKAS